MTNKINDFDEIFNEEPIEETKLNLEEIQQNIHLYSSQKLCDIIICDRYFGLEKTLSVICMEELSKRRLAGDAFNFEDYIEKGQKELPILDFSSMTDIRTVLNRMTSATKGGKR